MKREIIDFTAVDGAVLNGYINKVNNNKKVLIEIHGMTSNCFKIREKIIAEEVEKMGIDTICINTRGSEIARYVKFEDGHKTLGGTAFENASMFGIGMATDAERYLWSKFDGQRS